MSQTSCSDGVTIALVEETVAETVVVVLKSCNIVLQSN